MGNKISHIEEPHDNITMFLIFIKTNKKKIISKTKSKMMWNATHSQRICYLLWVVCYVEIIV